MGIEEIKKAKEEAKRTFTRPSQKVAALLIALGPATASEILKNIKDEDLLEQITLDIANLGKISDEDLNEVLTEEQSTTVLLETMSRKGSEIGRNFDELRQIIDRVERKDKLGVCLDTCHVWDGGYDIVNNLDGVFTEFDSVIGLDRLKAIHLNDSMNGLGSHKDRHAKIGEGEIGLEALVRVIRHPATKGIPFILETPNDDEGWTREIALLRKEYEGK